MKTNVVHPSLTVCLCALICAALLYLALPAGAQKTTPSASLRVGGGLQTVTFETASGRVIVHLPDDMAAGDKISGTVITEPKGSTEEERVQAQSSLGNYVLRIGDHNVPVTEPAFTWNITFPPQQVDSGYKIAIAEIPTATPSHTTVPPSTAPPAPTTDPEMVAITIRPFENRDFYWWYQKAKPPQHTQQPSAPSNFIVPPMGQQARPIELFGPFDGNSSNTILMFGPSGSTLQDFEKNTESVSGGYGVIKPLAESPRKIIFQGPTNVTGPTQIMVKEGNVETLGPYRNIGIRLSAPKTNLMRGERTTLTVEVRGLEGIREDVPLQLDSKGVITMDGGNFQNLRIKPPEVTQDGRYTTTRAITGQQAGSFTVTATVIARPFDTDVQDDSNRGTVLLFNTFTGDYIFCCPTVTGKADVGGGTTVTDPRASTLRSTKLTLTGAGKPVMKGCVITLTHDAPDRRVFAKLDTCTKTGDASVQTPSPKATFNVTDKNVTDNACPSAPPK